MVKRKKVVKVSLLSLGGLIVAALIAGNVVQLIRYNNLKEQNLSTDQRIAKYEKEISKTYTLPSGEKATLADVKSAEDLKKDEANKEFFKDSADGDIVLIYPNTKLGILYRPTSKKIIKTGPLAFKQQLTAAIIGAKTERASVIETLKKTFANDITSATEIDAKAPLAVGSTVVVDLTGKNTDLVERLATELKGKVGDVPEGQDKPANGYGIAIYIAPAQ